MQLEDNLFIGYLMMFFNCTDHIVFNETIV